MGGAEKVVEILTEIFPEAPLHTSVYLPDRVAESFRQKRIATSFMQSLPLMRTHFKWYFLLYPFAFETMNVAGADAVLTSSSAYAKGVHVPPDICHICYCYTPTRFLWEYEEYVKREEFPPLARDALHLLLAPLKRWDLRAAGRIDYFIAISEYVREKIRRTYGRESEVIYPPVDIARYKIAERVGDYFLVVSRLNAYKRIDIVIEAFNALGLPLHIVGTGTFEKSLRAMARDNITFRGRLDDSALIEEYGGCRALIFPGCEDFGLVPVEANACGRPVIAYAAGGALETVEEGVNGLLFKEQTPAALGEAIRRFDRMAFDPQIVRARSERYDKSIFASNISAAVREKTAEFKRKIGDSH